MVLLAENARIPIDNPATHLELTMIHEAMLLEYSARHLALIEWASALKLFNYSCIGFALFLPVGHRRQGDRLAARCSARHLVLIVKLAMGGGRARADRDPVAPSCACSGRRSSSRTAFLLAVLGPAGSLAAGELKR